MRVYHSISRLTLRHALSISLTAPIDGLLFSSLLGAQCESYPRVVVPFGADTAIGPMHFRFSSPPVRHSGSLRARPVFVSGYYYQSPFHLTHVHIE
jgi:hypothetical protein